MQTAEFAVVQRIDHEPAFNWWVKHVQKKRNKIIASIIKWQNRYLKRIHKLDMKFQKTVEQTHALDAKNDNTIWADATSREMENDKVALDILPDGKSVPIGHQFL